MKIRPWPESVLHLRPVVAAIALVLAVSIPAFGQLTPVGSTAVTLKPGGTVVGVDTAYDPVHSAYLVVTAFGPVFGVFVDGNNAPLSPVFFISDGSAAFGHRPVAIYSPDLNNGAGGTGAFLVLWNAAAVGTACGAGTPCAIQDRIVSLTAPGFVVNGIQTVTDPSQGSNHFDQRSAVAYSRTSHRFLVAWATNVPVWGLQARLVDTTGAPVSGVMRLAEGNSRDPSVAWNPGTDEFGVTNSGWNSGSAFVQFRIISPGGGVSSTSTFGYGKGSFATATDVNSSNQYVLVWGLQPGTVSAIFDQNGNPLGTTFVTNRIGGDASLDMAFNSTTNTFAVVGSDFLSLEVAAAELYTDGVPRTAAGIVTSGTIGAGSNFPRVVQRTGTNQWDIVDSNNYLAAVSQTVASSGFFGTPPGVGSALGAPPASGGGTSSGSTSTAGCSTPDPFTSIGGGTCVNGGWLPGGSGASSSSSTGGSSAGSSSASTGGCSGSDPFVSIGGGHCVGGGWLPGPAPATSGGSTSTGGSTPSTPTTSSTCSGSDPFVSIGGGHCVSGGWLPGPAPATSGGSTSTGGSTSSTSSSTCSGSDPFASIGGGHCVNGGWLPGPGPSTSSGTCTTPDPFTSVGGGTCVGGGWVPSGLAGGCTTPDPFTSVGGGVCVNGGWTPKG